MSTPGEAGPRTLVVVPVYDEEPTIRRLLDEVLAAAPEVDVLVVDDASPDGTGDVVAARPEPAVHLLRRAGKDGLGAAYRAGFAWALASGYDVVVQMDADLSHPPARLPALLAAVAGGADLAIGSRYAPGGGTRGWSRRREVLSRSGNAYVRRVLGLRVHDATAGYRAFRAPLLERVDALGTRSNGYCLQVETTLRAVRAGARVEEVPIVFVERVAGRSKMDVGIVVETLARVTGWGLRDRLARRRPALPRSS